MKMFQTLLASGGALVAAASAAVAQIPTTATPTVIVSTSAEAGGGWKVPAVVGIAEAVPVPEWFRDAKFGIWAHWGPQCQPEHGDWYAREHV